MIFEPTELLNDLIRVFNPNHPFWINKFDNYVWSVFAVRRKVILCYPEWTSKRIFMGDIQNSGLDLVKVARDFDNLTLPEPSTNIVLRFTYYDVSSPFPSTIFYINCLFKNILSGYSWPWWYNSLVDIYLLRKKCVA